jgi:hypothetical protein
MIVLIDLANEYEILVEYKYASELFLDGSEINRFTRYGRARISDSQLLLDLKSECYTDRVILPDIIKSYRKFKIFNILK